MNRIAYAILVVAGAILYGAGAIVEALRPPMSAASIETHILEGVGFVIGLIGLIGFIATAVRPTTPAPEKKGETET